jgi:hypothetical protein
MKPITEGVENRTTMIKGHPIAPPSGQVAIARLNLYEKIGPGTHACNWCGRDVTWQLGHYAPGNLIADHLNWDTTDDSPSNLVPSCSNCNTHRRSSGDNRRIESGELTVEYGAGVTRASKLVCENEECGKEFLAALNASRRFCSQECYHSSKTAMRPVEHTCERCNGAFPAARSAKRRFCSQECFVAARKKQVEYTCKRCLNKFSDSRSSKRIYCSGHCRAKGPMKA